MSSSARLFNNIFGVTHFPHSPPHAHSINKTHWQGPINEPSRRMERYVEQRDADNLGGNKWQTDSHTHCPMWGTRTIEYDASFCFWWGWTMTPKWFREEEHNLTFLQDMSTKSWQQVKEWVETDNQQQEVTKKQFCIKLEVKNNPRKYFLIRSWNINNLLNCGRNHETPV